MKKLIIDDKNIMEYYQQWVNSCINREQTRIEEKQQHKGEV